MRDSKRTRHGVCFKVIQCGLRCSATTVSSFNLWFKPEVSRGQVSQVPAGSTSQPVAANQLQVYRGVDRLTSVNVREWEGDNRFQRDGSGYGPWSQMPVTTG
jgi:hypothetical protein